MRKTTLKEKRDESIRRIMDAATEIFADAGFAGARVDEIAKRAGVNKAMIYYRIGDKEVLYTEVLHHVFRDTAERIALNIKEGQSPEEKLRMYIRNLIITSELQPHMPSIMMREFSSGGRNLPKVVANDFTRMLDILLNIIKEGWTKGVFIKTNPLIPHMMAVGAMVFYRASMPLMEKYFEPLEEIMDLDKQFSKGMVQEIEKLILRAMRK
ncbi:TetR/AcrR family transcriptional regulator [Thermodesulfobacteriota bacterium]